LTIALPYRRPEFSAGALAFVHAVGLLGLTTPWKDWFVAMTPVTLLLSAAVLLLHHRDWNLAFVAVLAVIFLVGYGVEVAGVTTGVIFGEYSYGGTLGWKVLDVPLVIGVNWLILVYCTGSMTARLGIPKWAKAAVGAGLMTGLDILIEPIAIRFDYWTWVSGTPPLQNYIAWFGVAFLLLLMFQYLKFDKQNKVAMALFFIQFAFFAILNIFF
jgi:putative membrane protein